MLIFKILGKLIKILRDGATPGQIAGGITLGMFVGMLPGFNLLTVVFALIIFLLNVNISAAILGWLLFKLAGFMFDPLLHSIGFRLLAETDWLLAFWTMLYNAPVIPLSQYNNTIVLGGLVMSLLLAIPVFFVSRSGVVQYREKLDPKIQQFGPIKMLKNNKIYEVYQNIRNMGDV